MGLKLSQDDFKKDMLSYKAAALLSEFALILYRQYGILIDVDSNDVIQRIFQNANCHRDRRLRSICLHIKTELCVNFVRSKANRNVA